MGDTAGWQCWRERSEGAADFEASGSGQADSSGLPPDHLQALPRGCCGVQEQAHRQGLHLRYGARRVPEQTPNADGAELVSQLWRRSMKKEPIEGFMVEGEFRPMLERGN